MPAERDRENEQPDDLRKPDDLRQYDFTGIIAWNEIQGWFNLPKAVSIQYCVKQLPPGARMVELGSFHGRSSVAIAAVMPPDAVLYCVDHFRGSDEHFDEEDVDTNDIRAKFLENIERFGVADRIRVVAKSTLEAADEFDEASLDFLLLDASHDYASVKADLDAWYPKLAPGGMLFCDDYDRQWPGVIEAVKESKLAGTLIAPALWMHKR